MFTDNDAKQEYERVIKVKKMEISEGKCLRTLRDWAVFGDIRRYWATLGDIRRY